MSCCKCNISYWALTENKGQTFTVSRSAVYPQISELRVVLSPGEVFCTRRRRPAGAEPINERELSLAAREKSIPPGFHQHFSPHWWENSGRGQKLYILYKHSSERQHTDSFFGVCENEGGPPFSSFVVVSVNSVVGGRAQCFILTQGLA